MNKDKIIRYVKIVITVVVLLLFIWFLFVYPFISFKSNEKTFLNAAKRYFEVNRTLLPSGDNIRTITLKTLYHKSFLSEDLKIPYSTNTCSVDDSWVKVKKVNNEYKYYVYLKCGALSSSGVDHEGPKIVLNGDSSITLNKGEEYKELGVKSVDDKTDGSIDTSKVTINSNKVNTNKIGIYKVKYSVKDSFNNETVVERVIKVESILKNIINKDTNNNGIYKGVDVDNYIMFSGLLYRIVGFDSNNNIKIVSDDDISFIDYNSLDKWLDYYYEHISDSSKKYIVKSQYCNDVVNDTSVTKCSNYTNKRNLYILSIEDYNNSIDNDGYSYLYPDNISLVSNKKSDKEIYTTRNYFMNQDSKYMSFDINYHFGVRPVITIKNNISLISGNGSVDSPYKFEKETKAKVGDKINTRNTGEYVEIGNSKFRIIETEDDGTTKVILNDNIQSGTLYIGYNTDNKDKVYNPKEKGNIGYYINNNVSEFINDKYFASKNIDVPIYKKNSSYSGKYSKKTYKVKFSAPNMYDLFTLSDYYSSYWLINSSLTSGIKYVVSDNGTVYYKELDDSFTAGVKIVGYLNKNCTIKSGKGTKFNPYVISK